MSFSCLSMAARGSETVLATIGEIARAEGASVRLVSVRSPVHKVEIEGRIVAYADQESKQRCGRTSSAWRRP